MTIAQLENLVRIGQLRREEPAEDELSGLRRSAQLRLADASRPELSLASRFDLAYNAAHGLALYCLRRTGYRATTRLTAFQALAHTSHLETAQWRVLVKAHQRRNLAEYEGHMDVDDRLLDSLLGAARALLEEVGSSHGSSHSVRRADEPG